MKRIIYIALILFTLAGVNSCNSLDVPPPNILTDREILGSEAGLDGYISTMYYNLPIEDFRYRVDKGFDKFESFWTLSFNTGEVLQQNDFRWWEISSNGFEYWPYTDVRNANYLIANIEKNLTGVSQQTINKYVGEAYFCRAFLYFALVKRYGGVPIINQLQDPTAPIDGLRVPRDTEEAVYEQIRKDLDEAIRLLPTSNISGRATKYAAAALKSRAMLYAGSIAKYTKTLFDGSQAKTLKLVGIPQERAEYYFSEAHGAALIVAEAHSLYRKDANLVTNYINVFASKDSPESILIKEYKYRANKNDNIHNWNCFASSPSTSTTYSGGYCPTVDVIEHGGKLKISKSDGTPIVYDSREAFLESLTPRQRAIALFPGQDFRNKTIDVQAGLYETLADINGNPITSNDEGATHTYEGKAYNIIGFDGIRTSIGNRTPTGLYMGKYNERETPVADVYLWNSTQHWIVLRYAEVLLNRAEAAFEIGGAEMLADALECMTMIKERGGETAPTSSELTLDYIRNERRFELAFENHDWWDLRRWRIGEREIFERVYYALYPYYVIKEDKWVYKKKFESHQKQYKFNTIMYYEPIPGGEINKNPKLLPNNPLY